VEWVPKAWYFLLSGYLFCRREDLAESLWVELMQANIPRGILEWNALLEGYRDMGSVEKIISTWDSMRADGVTPNDSSYSAKLIAFSKAGLAAEAVMVFKEFQKLPFSDEERLPVYNALLNAYCHYPSSVSSPIFELFTEMKEKGPKPDLISYNTILRYYSRQRDARQAIVLLEEMEATGISPDVYSFTTVLTALFRSGAQDPFKSVQEIMHARGITENVATYTTMIDHLVNEGSIESLKAAFEYLDRMEHLPNAHPNEITYTAMLTGIYRNQNLDGEEVARLTVDITRRMTQRGFRLKRGTYQILVSACLSNPKPEGLKSALMFFKNMQKKNIPLAHDTWWTLLSGLSKRQAWAVANRMVDEMLGSGFRMNHLLSNLVRRIRSMRQ